MENNESDTQAESDSVAAVTSPAETSGATPVGPSLQLAVPVLLFLAVNRVAGLRWAVVAATLWSIKVIVDRRRRGLPLGVFMPIVTAAVLARGAIGAITGSETVYFGLGIATKYGFAAILIGSLLAQRPLASLAAPFLMELPPKIAGHQRFLSAMKAVTAVAALYYLISATFDVWLLRRSSVEGYVVVRFIANWPLSAAALIAIFAVLRFHVRKIPGAPPLPTLIEQRMAQYRPPEPSAGSPNTPQNGS